jgi:hypothetical protein
MRIAICSQGNPMHTLPEYHSDHDYLLTLEGTILELRAERRDITVHVTDVLQHLRLPAPAALPDPWLAPTVGQALAAAIDLSDSVFPFSSAPTQEEALSTLAVSQRLHVIVHELRLLREHWIALNPALLQIYTRIPTALPPPPLFPGDIDDSTAPHHLADSIGHMESYAQQLRQWIQGVESDLFGTDIYI